MSWVNILVIPLARSSIDYCIITVVSLKNQSYLITMKNTSLDKKELENDRPLELEESGRERIGESHEPRVRIEILAIASQSKYLLV